MEIDGVRVEFRFVGPAPYEGRRYDVLVAGEAVGAVESYRTESWHTAGSRSIRTALRGRPLLWTYSTRWSGKVASGRGFSTRKEATAAIIEQIRNAR